MYARTDDQGKRLANQAFYQRILITEDEKAATQLNEPLAAPHPHLLMSGVLIPLIWWT